MKYVEISLLNSCNFHCDYCISSSLKATSNNTQIFDVNGPVLNTFDLLAFIDKNLKNYTINLTGGEPLTHPSIDQILQFLFDNNITTILSTNGQLLKKFKSRIPKNVKLRISFHPEQRNLEEFRDLINELKDDFDISINYVVHPRHIENKKVYEYISFLNDLFVIYELTQFRGTYKNKIYHPLDEIYNEFRDEYTKVENDSFEWIVIKPNGRIHPCHSDGYNSIQTIGDIYTGELDLTKTCKYICSGPDNISLCPTYDWIKKIVL